jgi:phage terminase large subunit
MCIFSEYALQDPRAYQYIRPILAANDGVAVFLSTPRGKNHLFELYNIAQQAPNWFCQKLTLDDTQHIPLYEIEREKTEGIMSEDLIQQEYYTSFTLGVEGSYYMRYLDKMRVKGQIGIVPWESGFKVNTAWDIGVRDSTTIIFFQVIGQTVRIIDCYENSKQGLEHYVKIIEQKPYSYNKHIAPHDIKVTEWGTGLTRIEKARQLGIQFTVAPDLLIEDGIEAVRSAFSKIWIDETNCATLLKALENYRQEFDVKKKIYKSQPLHDWSSHFADCMRYLCISLSKTADGMSPQEIDKRYAEALYGNSQVNLPSIFRDDLPQW